MKTLWDNNEIQFARLLCEIVANVDFSPRDYVNLCDSMDLEPNNVSELLERANDVWERAKKEV